MAIPTNLSFVLFSLLAISTGLAKAQIENQLKETNMTLYLHDFLSGPNTNDIPVAGVAGKLSSFFEFGSFFIFDDYVTETCNFNSTLLGRAQGIYPITSPGGIHAYMSMSILFTNGAYNGSTLEVQGIYKQFEPSTELSVVSGTGKFRYARGYVTFDIYYYDPTTYNSITRANISVFHYY